VLINPSPAAHRVFFILPQHLRPPPTATLPSPNAAGDRAPRAHPCCDLCEVQPRRRPALQLRKGRPVGTGGGGGGVGIKEHGSVQPTEHVRTNEFGPWSDLLWTELKTATPTASCSSDLILSEIWNSVSGKRHVVVNGASSIGFSWEGRTLHPLP